MNLLLGLASATERPFSNKAPVGHTWTHLPQLVQVVDTPHGVPMSVMTGTRRHDQGRPMCERLRSRRTHARNGCTGCTDCGR